jgi:hypothetical protein
MRQQLVWVVGSLIPLIISFSLAAGDFTMAVLAGLGGLSYVSGRRAAHTPRLIQRDVRDFRGPRRVRDVRDVRDIGEVGEAGGS